MKGHFEVWLLRIEIELAPFNIDDIWWPWPNIVQVGSFTKPHFFGYPSGHWEKSNLSWKNRRTHHICWWLLFIKTSTHGSQDPLNNRMHSWMFGHATLLGFSGNLLPTISQPWRLKKFFCTWLVDNLWYNVLHIYRENIQRQNARCYWMYGFV